MKQKFKWKYEIGENIKDEKRDLLISDRYFIKNKDNHTIKHYKYLCKKCGYNNGDMIENKILQGGGCSCCYGRTVVEGINDSPSTAQWMVKYFQGGYEEAKLYTRCSHNKITPVCPECKRTHIKEVIINNLFHRHGYKCGYCMDGISFSEKFIYFF